MKSVSLQLFTALLPLFATIYAHSHQDEGDISTEASEYKCVYEGVTYNVGDDIPPTHNKCWACRCREGFTEPNPQMCARIDCPRRPRDKRGCVPIREENKCCPVGYNCTSVASNVDPPEKLQDRCHNCDQRYFKHYEAKQCKPVYDEGCECPSRFDCSEQISSDTEDKTVCKYKGQPFAEGQDIPTSNPCEICSCRKNFLSGALTVSCIPIECGSMFRGYQEGCYDVYEEGKCCPSTQKCSGDSQANETLSDALEPVCEFEGKIYQPGQRMYSEEDSCLSCLCDENFHGKNSSSCRHFECTLERRMHELQTGCIPIYHEKTCCPIEFHCSVGDEVIIPSSSYSSVNQSDTLNQCTFKEHKYNIGDILDIKHPTNCVTCTCTTPPDFTCIHKVCPPPPDNDYERCQSIYTPGECCPKYQCPQHAAAPQKICDPVRCEGGCVEISVPRGCPMCQCQSLLCSPPVCQPGCEVNYDIAPGSCPTCKCIDEMSYLTRPMCDPVKCSPQCFEGISPQGCPMCVCGPICSPPKCDEGCHIQTDFADGECPGCVCPDTTGSQDTKVLCAPVKCPPMCHEVRGDTGCPMCECTPMCSPPKCLSGCQMETPPYAGPCPGCVCGDKEKLSAAQCAPVKCSPGCDTIYVPNGCPMCRCTNILCSPPKCQEGCTVETEFPPGGCPGCKCPPSMPLDRPMCGPVKCGPQCHEGISPQGCPMCVCGPLCSPPKCEKDCRIQTDVPTGQCPGCTCNSADESHGESYVVQCSPVMCPSFCRKTIGDSGCETCVCDPMCSPPKCATGCRVEVIPSSGPCPGCVCDGRLNPPVQCYPVQCDPGCQERVDLAQSPCPYCVCDDEPRLLHDVQCSPPKCEPGCIPKLIPPGPCASCSCENNDRVPQQIACYPPKCEPGCFAKLIPPGPCPTCSCENNERVPQQIACYPPKCEPGCFPKLIPPGPCPSCSCENNERVPQQIACYPPKCEPGCFPKLIPPGPCPTCSCENNDRVPQQIACYPPKCEPGCFAKLIPPGPCPSCSCENNERVPHDIQCSVPKCEPGCFPKLTPPHPCPACSCGDMTDAVIPTSDVQCAPVKCGPGCHMEMNVAPGTCPSCVCDNRQYRALDQRVQCSLPRCDYGCYPKVIPPGRCASCYCRTGGQVDGLECPQMKCDYPCRMVSLTPTSCPMCICDNFPLCSMPQCEPGCHTEVLSENGCPECVCTDNMKPDEARIRQTVACYPPRCRPGCPARLIRGPCPSCSC